MVILRKISKGKRTEREKGLFFFYIFSPAVRSQKPMRKNKQEGQPSTEKAEPQNPALAAAQCQAPCRKRELLKIK